MMRAVILAVVLMVMAAGCTTTSGVEVQRSQLLAFQKGVTTDEDVIKALGAPAMSSLTSEGERVLIYSFAQYKTFSGTSGLKASSAVLNFDKNRKLVSYTASESKFNSELGAATAAPEQPRQ